MRRALLTIPLLIAPLLVQAQPVNPPYNPNNVKITGGTITGANTSGANVTPVDGAQTALKDALSRTFQTSKTTPVGYAFSPRILNRNAAVKATDNPQYNPAMTAPSWTASTTYGTGDVVTNSGGTYEQQFGLSCVSAASGGPSGTGANIVDGTCIWMSAPDRVASIAGTPTITTAVSWSASGTHKVGDMVVAFTGAGATAVGNFYTQTVATCTSASSGGPTGTGTGITDGTCSWNYAQSFPTANFSSSSVNSFLWLNGTGRSPVVINSYGGTPATTGGAQFENVLSTTVGGVFSAKQARYEFITTAPKFVIRTFDQTTNGVTLSSSWRLIVCNSDGSQCHYVADKPFSPAANGSFWGYTIVDFTSTSSRAPRQIIIEYDGQGGAFGGIDVNVGDDVWKPTGMKPISMAMTGDSYGVGSGLYNSYYKAFAAIAADYLGVTNFINTSVPGCGFLIVTGACSSSGTALSRIGDVAGANSGSCPDMLIEANGTNDIAAGFNATQIAAAMTTYLQAVRTACPPSMPIFVMGIWPHNSGGASYAAGVAAENAMSAAVAALSDPYIFFIPVTTDPAGAWQTGTGAVGAAVGTATFATNVMTVTGTTSGTWQIGEVITAAGVTAGTKITAFGTGTGANGTYTLSTSPGTIGSEAVSGNAQLADGNCDYTYEGFGSPQNGHMNALGNRMFSGRLVAAIRNALNASGY